jgi:hypothetical protein
MYATLKQGRGRGRIDIRSEGSMRGEHKNGRPSKEKSIPTVHFHRQVMAVHAGKVGSRLYRRPNCQISRTESSSDEDIPSPSKGKPPPPQKYH